MTSQVLIVGAGPTGLLMGNLLGSMGVRTTIVERNPSTVDAPRAVSIDDESMRALQAVGLSDRLLEIVQKGYGSIYRGPTGQVFATVKPSSRIYGFEKRNAFQQPELEALMRDGLSRFSNVDLRFGCELKGVSQNDDGVAATIETGTGPEKFTAQYMVACDGGRSTVRKLRDIPLEGSTFTEPWLIVDLKSTQNRCFHTEVFCNPKRPCITLPGPGGIRRYEFKLKPGETADLAEKEPFVRALLADFGPDANQPIRRRQVYTFHARSAKLWREDRIFLAGDAAHLTPPFAGQGLNSGLRDAHNLSWKLDEALRSAAPDRLLDSYQVEREPHAISMINLALRMGQIMMPTSQVQGFFVRAGFHALGLVPPARDYFAQMKYKPKPRFAGGLIAPDSRPDKSTIVGSLIPQPLIETPDAKVGLLDQFLPDKPCVLVFSECPEAMLSPREAGTLADRNIAVFGLAPEWSKAQPAHFPTGRDANRLFSERQYQGYLDHFILLRRDRYVAATARDMKNLRPMMDLLCPVQAGRDRQMTLA